MTFLKKCQKKTTTDLGQVNMINLIKEIFKILTRIIIIAIKIALETAEIVLIIHQDQNLIHLEENHNVYEKNNFLFFIINKF